MTNTKTQQPVSLTDQYRDLLKHSQTPLLDLVKQNQEIKAAKTKSAADRPLGGDARGRKQSEVDYLTLPDRVSLYELGRGKLPSVTVPTAPAEPLDRQSFTSVNPQPEVLYRTIENALRDWGEQRDEWLREEVDRTWEDADEDQDLHPNPYRSAGKKGLAHGDEWDYDEFDNDLWPQTVGHAEPEPEEAGDGYLDKVARQLVMGNYTDDVTVLGTLGQVLLGFAGLDTAADIRDLTYDLTNWAWSPEHVRQTLLDAIGFIPAIGIVKNADEVSAVLKGILGNPEAATVAAKALLSGTDALGAAARRGTELLDGLGTLLKSLPEKAGAIGALAMGTLKTVGDYADEAADAMKAAGHLDEASDAVKAVAHIDEASDAAEAAAKGFTGTADLPSAPARAAAEGAGKTGKIPWDSWQNYEKVTTNGQEYAKVGDRLYSKHAVDRMQPSGKRFTVGDAIVQAGGVSGRSIAPQFVENVINSVKPVFQPATGNYIYTSSTVKVVTNEYGYVVTIITVG